MRASIILLLALVGCGDKAADQPANKPADKPAAPTSEAVKAPIQADQVAKLADRLKTVPELKTAIEDGKIAVQGLGKDAGEALTQDQVEALLLALATCTVGDEGIDRECPANKAWREARKSKGTLVKDWGGMLATLGQKHVKHENPAVRIQAASLMGSIFGATNESQQAIIDAATAEKDPQVLKSMLRAVSSSIKRNDAVRLLVLAQAGHADEKVRMEVVGALTSSWARDTEGTLEKAIEITEKDASNDVRQYACRRLGERADERALPLLLKLTADHKTDPKLHSACVRGLIAMWSAPVPHKVPSQKAYEATLALLKRKPRDENLPPWTAISAVEWAGKDRFQQAAPWYKKADLVGALAEVIADHQTNWLARTASVDAMQRLGAEPADFEKLKKAYADAADKPGTDKHVFDKLTKALGGGK